MTIEYDSEKHHRRSIRLKDFDYSQAGAYFITICTHNRTCLFGEVADGEMKLNDLGETVKMVLLDLTQHYRHVEIDEFVIMPNHIHFIIILHDTVEAGWKPAPTIKRHGVPEIVRGFKTFSARHINQTRNTLGIPVWQRNYYEHVIRNDDDLNQTREYVTQNPLQWELDEENPSMRKLDKQSEIV
jgi:putative transposase